VFSLDIGIFLSIGQHMGGLIFSRKLILFCSIALKVRIVPIVVISVV